MKRRKGGPVWPPGRNGGSGALSAKHEEIPLGYPRPTVNSQTNFPLSIFNSKSPPGYLQSLIHRRKRRSPCTLAVPKIFCGIRLEYFDRGAKPCSLFRPLGALRRLCSLGRLPYGFLVIPHPSRLRRATFPFGKAALRVACLAERFKLFRKL